MLFTIRYHDINNEKGIGEYRYTKKDFKTLAAAKSYASRKITSKTFSILILPEESPEIQKEQYINLTALKMVYENCWH